MTRYHNRYSYINKTKCDAMLCAQVEALQPGGARRLLLYVVGVEGARGKGTGDDAWVTDVTRCVFVCVSFVCLFVGYGGRSSSVPYIYHHRVIDPSILLK